MTENRIIVALDVDSAAEARALVARLGDDGLAAVGAALDDGTAPSPSGESAGN